MGQRRLSAKEALLILLARWAAFEARFLWGCKCGRSCVILHAAIAGGVPYREGKEMGRGCLSGSCLSLLVFDLCRPLKEA